MKFNHDFKNGITERLQKNLTFRWDLLHLANRSHISARGKADTDNYIASFDEDKMEFDSDSENGELESTTRVSTLISSLINYIQV